MGIFINLLSSGILFLVTIFFILIGIVFVLAASKLNQLLQKGDYKNNNLEQINSACTAIKIAYILIFIAAAVTLILTLLYASHETLIYPSEYLHLTLFLIIYGLLIASTIYAFISLYKLYDVSVTNNNGANSYIWAGLFLCLLTFIGLFISNGTRFGRHGIDTIGETIEEKIKERIIKAKDDLEPIIRNKITEYENKYLPIVKNKIIEYEQNILPMIGNGIGNEIGNEIRTLENKFLPMIGNEIGNEIEKLAQSSNILPKLSNELLPKLSNKLLPILSNELLPILSNGIGNEIGKIGQMAKDSIIGNEIKNEIGKGLEKLGQYSKDYLKNYLSNKIDEL